MRTWAEISRESRRSTERLEQLDADRTRLAEQLNELEITERVLTRFGGAATKEKTRGKGAKEVSMQRDKTERTSLPLRLCYDLFEVDRLGQEARRNPADVDRLTTAIDSLAVVLQTPFFSPDKATGPADARAELHTGTAERGGRRRRAKALEYKVDFGAVAAFIDLMSGLVTDDTIRIFTAAVARDGANHVFSNFEQRTRGIGFLDDDIGEEVLGFLRFLDLSVNISSFLGSEKDKAFGDAMLSCLKPLYSPELERFCLLVQEASRKAMFAGSDSAGPDREDPIFFLWDGMDKKLNTVRSLIQQVRRNRLRVRPSEAAIRTYGSDVVVLQIAREMQRVAGELTRADAERTELSDRLNEMKITQRVLSRFASGEGKRRVSRHRVTLGQGAPRGGHEAAAVSLSDATLRAVQAHGEGATANQVMEYLAREFGMTVRPNHLGIALQRHRRAGRLENRDQKWHLPQSGQRYLSEDEEMRA